MIWAENPLLLETPTSLIQWFFFNKTKLHVAKPQHKTQPSYASAQGSDQLRVHGLGSQRWCFRNPEKTTVRMVLKPRKRCDKLPTSTGGCRISESSTVCLVTSHRVDMIDRYVRYIWKYVYLQVGNDVLELHPELTRAFKWTKLELLSYFHGIACWRWAMQNTIVINHRHIANGFKETKTKRERVILRKLAFFWEDFWMFVGILGLLNFWFAQQISNLHKIECFWICGGRIRRQDPKKNSKRWIWPGPKQLHPIGHRKNPLQW